MKLLMMNSTLLYYFFKYGTNSSKYALHGTTYHILLYQTKHIAV